MTGVLTDGSEVDGISLVELSLEQAVEAASVDRMCTLGLGSDESKVEAYLQRSYLDTPASVASTNLSF